MAREDADQSSSDIDATDLLDGLEGDARRDRAELIAWLLERGFTSDEIRASVSPMLLPANRVMGDDGVYVSAPSSRPNTPRSGTATPRLFQVEVATSADHLATTFETQQTDVLSHLCGELSHFRGDSPFLAISREISPRTLRPDTTADHASITPARIVHDS